ncbi:lysylphosphatidylglycerol synthase domain-containing protein [Pseudomonas sp. 148P]|uniref:Lysylphosphatidylglycerol synthase domain-containing protein n=1 Tax=Pseudomonas ulcerans TaxID=3115852 RepID=A0ABU7HTJ4_9PSED|nr:MULTISPECIES: lysylphosphatidylglycerol synthase domain-containing protein [unclassified Pseudomonas]MEE1923261.1 lysylphosphatidylglycerol synthase domain-containing protein [Pseudomonas sp. 147P]MEE1934864.1 lysylphosphatidylglycerol synthase domain-containing protein [Pseudomonas sp. 148P]
MKHPLWKRARQALTVLFFILVPVLLFMLLRNQDWGEVWHALSSYRPGVLLTALAIAACSFALFSSYDLLGRRYTGHHLPARQVLPLAFVCYAFNLNLSAWVGGVALRYRLYSRLGLETATITRLLGFGLVTNWLGYLLVAGSLFALGFPKLPAGLEIGTTGLRLIGAGMLVVAVTYLLACRFASRREWQVRGHAITLPGWRLAALQALMGAGNWCLMGLVVFTLLPDKAGYPTILAILLVSSIAGVITHIPAGLGVLESVFITLLQGQYSQGTLLAALIGYRAVYFLLPLLLACVVYLLLERVAARQRGGAAPSAVGGKAGG